MKSFLTGFEKRAAGFRSFLRGLSHDVLQGDIDKITQKHLSKRWAGKGPSVDKAYEKATSAFDRMHKLELTLKDKGKL